MVKPYFSVGVTAARLIIAGVALSLGGFQHGWGEDAAVPSDSPSTSKPVVEGPEGQRAFDDLAKIYVNSSGLFDDKAALADLKRSDASTAHLAGNYFLALLEQSFADESNGRASWNPTPFTNEGPDNRAHDFRQALAKGFGESASTEAALPAAIWLIENDPVAENAEAGAHVLVRIHSDRANAAINNIIAEVHPDQEILVTAIREAGTRHLTQCKDDVVSLEQSYRTAVRKAADRAAVQLGETKPVMYDPLKAFSPRVLAFLKVTLERIQVAMPPDAQWLDGIAQPDWRPSKPYAVHGWLISRDGDNTTFLDAFGQVRTVTSKQVVFTPGNLGKTAENFAALQATVAEDKRGFEAIQNNPAMQNGNSPEARALSQEMGRLWHDMDEKLKEMTTYMNYMGPPGGNFVNLPEINVAAWCWQRGDLAHAAQVLFPCYDEARNDRWIDWAARDSQGDIYHQEMLDKFTSRDYAGALALAIHLNKPVFDGYYYQARAKELATQLPARTEDFKTLTLPSPEDWVVQQAKLSWKEQIVYLASRLKLLHCVQPGQPAGVNYADPQFANSYPSYVPPKDDPKVINPFVELEKLNLTTNDLLVLAPFAKDNDYLLTYSFWRDFTPQRTLHRVSWVVGGLINRTAGHVLVQETENGISFDPKKGTDVVDDLKAWVAAHPNMSQVDMLAESLKTSTDWQVLQQTAQAALTMKHPEILRVLADRLEKIPKSKKSDYTQGQLAMLIFRSHLPLADDARVWVKSSNDELRFWAALMLVRDGDTKTGEGLDILPPLLDVDSGIERYLQAASTLLASPSSQAKQVACGVFKPMHYEGIRGSSFRGSDMLKRYFLAGKMECFDFLTAQMDDFTVQPNVHNDSGRPTFLSDAIVAQIGFWFNYHDPYVVAMSKGEKEERLYRAKLKTWLAAQFALIQQGQKCAIPPPPNDSNYITFLDHP